MLIRRMLVQVSITDNKLFIATVQGNSLPGVEFCTVREGTLEESAVLVILDGTLLNSEEKERWLKASLHKTRWVRVTGTVEIQSYVEGFYEREVNTSYQPSFHHLINLIAVEILSDFELDQTST